MHRVWMNEGNGFPCVALILALGTLDREACCLSTICDPLERQMSKRKPVKASKRARSPAIATRAHGKKQAVVKSARCNLLRSVAAGPIESPLGRHDDPRQESPNVEKQEAPIAANLVQDSPSPRGFDFASATGNLMAYQVKLLEMTQATHAICL